MRLGRIPVIILNPWGVDYDSIIDILNTKKIIWDEILTGLDKTLSECDIYIINNDKSDESLLEYIECIDQLIKEPIFYKVLTDEIYRVKSNNVCKSDSGYWLMSSFYSDKVGKLTKDIEYNYSLLGLTFKLIIKAGCEYTVEFNNFRRQPKTDKFSPIYMHGKINGISSYYSTPYLFTYNFVEWENKLDDVPLLTGCSFAVLEDINGNEYKFSNENKEFLKSINLETTRFSKMTLYS